VNTKRSSALAVSVVAAALTLALAGCAPASAGQGSGHAATVSHPSTAATIKPAPKPTLKPRLPSWNGDCTVFFTDAQTQTVTGLPTTLQPVESYRYSFDQVTTLGGGHDCWYSDADSDSEHVSFSVFPASLPGAAASAPKCENANTGQVQFQDTCAAASVSHGYWLNIDFSPGTTPTYVQAFAAVTAIETTFAAKTALYAPPVAPASIAGTWTKSETCDTLATHATPAAAIGYPTMGHAVDPIYNGNGAGFNAAQSSVGAIGCQFGTQAGLAVAGKLNGFEVYLVPGGGKLNPAAAAPLNATAVSVPGATAAWETDYNGDDVFQVYVEAGANYLEFTPNGATSISLAALAPAISKIISTMNSGG
jgi:hypothetical protein